MTSYDLFGLIHFLVERLVRRYAVHLIVEVKWCSLPFLLTILVAYTVQRYHIFPAGMWCLHPTNHTWNKAVSEKAGQCVNVGLIRLVSVLEVVISLCVTPQTVQFSYISRIHSVRYDSPTLNKYVIRNGGCFVQTRLTVLISIESEFLKNVPSTFFEYNKSVKFYYMEKTD